jgi:hypothetical protein
MIAERAYIATCTPQTNTRYLRTLLSRSLTIDSTALPRSKRRDPHRVYHLERVVHPRPNRAATHKQRPKVRPRDVRVSGEEWECLQRDKTADEAHKQEYKRLLKQEAAPRELATAPEQNTESAAATALEGAT